MVNLRQTLWVGVWNVLSLRDGDGLGIYLGDGQTGAPGVSVESGRSDTLWRMLPMYVCMYVLLFNYNIFIGRFCLFV